jgi:hypothetical protein
MSARWAIWLPAIVALLAPSQSPAQAPLVSDPLNARLAECAQSIDGDCLLALADFEGAADAFERFSRERKNDVFAPTALARAVELRRELGQPEHVLEDAGEFRRTFQGHPRLAEVAEEVFLLGDLYQGRGEMERAASHYGLYLKEWANVGGTDREVVAHVRLAELLLDKSCPVAGVRGACIEITQVPYKCSDEGVPNAVKAKQPTDLKREVIIRHQRDVALVEKAETHIKEANRLLGKRRLELLGRNPTERQARQNSLADASADSMLLAIQATRDEFLWLTPLPTTLDFEQPTPFDSPAVAARKKWRFEDSARRFAAWLTAKTRLFKLLQDTSRKAMAKLGPRAMVRAAGIMAEATTSFRAALTEEGENLRKCRPDESIHGGGEWLIEENTDTAITTCAVLADAILVDDEWSRFCQPRGSVNRHSPFWRVIRPTPPRQQSELLPGLRPDEADSDGTVSPGKPSHDPASEIHSNQFEPRPFPGYRAKHVEQKPKPAERKRGGVLKMNEGTRLAPGFERLPPFDTTMLDRLAERAGPSPLPNRASFLRLALLGARRECYYPLPKILFVKTAGNRIVKLETPQPGTNIRCLEDAAKSLALPKAYFNEARARWNIEL